MQQDDRGPMTGSQVLQRQSVHHRLVSTDHWGSLNGPPQGDRRKSLKHRPEHEGRARETVTHEHVDLLTSHMADHSYLTPIGGPLNRSAYGALASACQYRTSSGVVFHQQRNEPVLSPVALVALHATMLRFPSPPPRRMPRERFERSTECRLVRESCLQRNLR